jgi:hypothetical protein
LIIVSNGIRETGMLVLEMTRISKKMTLARGPNTRPKQS